MFLDESLYKTFLGNQENLTLHIEISLKHCTKFLTYLIYEIITTNNLRRHLLRNVCITLLHTKNKKIKNKFFLLFPCIFDGRNLIYTYTQESNTFTVSKV